MNKVLSNKKQILLIVLCWAIYTFAYLGRYSYTSNGVPIKRFYGVGSDEFSLVTTFFFFAYGVSQIISGLFCSKFNMRVVLPLALMVSSAINLFVFFGVPFYVIKYLWLINGICQAVLWPSLLRIISCYCEDKYSKLAVIAMSTTVAIGTFMSYGTSALFALFDGFKYSFLLGALFMTAMGTIMFLFYGKLTDNAKIENIVKPKSDNISKSQNVKGSDRKLISIFFVFGIYAVAINFIKDGLTTWVPHILSERYDLSDSLSMILTLVLPLLGIFGAMCAVALNKKVKDHSDLTGVFFLLSALCVLGIIIFFKTELWLIILAFFGIVNMFMHSANNIVTSMLPLSVGKEFNAGLVAGVLNGTCYVGSTLSQYGIAAIATATDWITVMRVLMCLCFISALFALIVKLLKQIRNIKKR